ncbi:CCAR2, partial [Cervus elaphus hippelaphus]
GGEKQRVFTGIVTSLHDYFGVVDEEVFFQLSVVKGRLPQLGEKVLVKAAYNPGQAVPWNAVKVQTLSNQPLLKSPAPPLLHVAALGQKQGILGAQPQLIFQPHRIPPLFPQKPLSLFQTSHTLHLSHLNRFPARGPHGRLDQGRSDDYDSKKRKQRAGGEPWGAKKPRHDLPPYRVHLTPYAVDSPVFDFLELQRRYRTLLVPSDFLAVHLSWLSAFPVSQPFSLHHPSRIQVSPEKEPAADAGAETPPTDSDPAYSSKVLLLSSPGLEELYRCCMLFVDDMAEPRETPEHPLKQIKFLLGWKDDEAVLVGGEWSPSLDGLDPKGDPQVLVRTATRCAQAQAGIDLSACTKWWRFAEFQYLQAGPPRRLQTVVVYLPDIWTVMPTLEEWEALCQQKAAEAAPPPPEVPVETEPTEQSADGSEQAADTSKQSAENPEVTAQQEVDTDLPEAPPPPLEPAVMARSRCVNLSLQSIVEDRRPKERISFEAGATVLAELFLEMLQRDFGYRIYKTLLSLPEKAGPPRRLQTVVVYLPDIWTVMPTLEEWEALCQQKAAEAAPPPPEVPVETEPTEQSADGSEQAADTSKQSAENPEVTAQQEVDTDLPEAPPPPLEPAVMARSRCVNLSLQSIVEDRRPKERISFEAGATVLAELFLEMLQRDFGYRIYKTLLSLPEKVVAPPEPEKEEAAKEEAVVKEEAKEPKDEVQSEGTAVEADAPPKEDGLLPKPPSSGGEDEEKPRGEASEDLCEMALDPELLLLRDDGEEEFGAKLEDSEVRSVASNQSEMEFSTLQDMPKELEPSVVLPVDCLLAFVYFDANWCGYLHRRDLERILLTLGLRLSAEQAKQLVSRAVSQNICQYRSLHYSRLEGPDGALPEDLLFGNLDLLPPPGKSGKPGAAPAEHKGLVSHNGSLINVGNLLQRAEQQDSGRLYLENKIHTLELKLEESHNRFSATEVTNKTLATEMQDLRARLAEAEEMARTAERQKNQLQRLLQEFRRRLTTLQLDTQRMLEKVSLLQSRPWRGQVGQHSRPAQLHWPLPPSANTRVGRRPAGRRWEQQAEERGPSASLRRWRAEQAPGRRLGAPSAPASTS